MEEPNAAEAQNGTPAPTAEAVAAPVVAPAPESVKSDVDQIGSLEEFLDMAAKLPSREEYLAQQQAAAAGGEQPPEQAPAAAGAGDGQPQAGDGKVAGGEQPPANPESAPEDEKGEDGNPKRIRIAHLSSVQKETALIMARNPDLEPEDAAAMARKKLGVSQPIPKPDPAAQQPVPAVTPTSVTDAQASLANLRAELKAATKNMEFEKQAELQDKIFDAQQALAVAKHEEAVKAAAETQRFEQTITRSKMAAVELYPDVTKADSPLVAKMQELDGRLKDTGNPLYHDPAKYLRIAQMAANELGIAPKSKASPSASVAPKAAPIQAPATGVRPAPKTINPPPPIASGRQHRVPTDVAVKLGEVLEKANSPEDLETLIREL